MLSSLLLLLLKLTSHLDKAWLLLMPVCGLLYGPELVVRVSFNALLLLIVAGLVKGVERCLDLDMSFLPSLVTVPLCAVQMALPVKYVPDAVVYLYGGVALQLENVAPLVEGVELTVLIMAASQWLVDGIDERPHICKGLILTVSGVSYLVVAYLLSHMVGSSLTTAQFSLLILTLLMLVAVHLVMWNYDVGTISDVAVLSAYVVFLIHCMVCDSQINAPFREASTLTVPDGPSSFAQLTLDVVTHFAATCEQLVSALTELLRIRYFVQLLLRFAACVLVVFHLDSVFEENVDEDSTIIRPSSSSSSSSSSLTQFLFRLIFLLMYTSLVVRNSAGDYSPLSDAPGASSSGSRAGPPFRIDGVALVTLAQIFMILGLYVQRVIGEEEFDDE